MPTVLSRRAFLTNAGLATLALRGNLLRALAAPTLADTTPITVQTPSGALRGEQSSGVNIFRGVPFAEPPTGPLRFRPPTPIKKWTGVREALHFPAAASQPTEIGVKRGEDCLYLNIWAPSGKGPFPVYVWIHGGGFTGGYSFAPIFDGAKLAQAGIILVSVAYRLGVLGFLDMEPLLGPEYAGSANNGVRDLIQALTWVQQNISAFGGDPTRVTVGGQSAGAKLTDILLGTPSAQPLFNQAISESGGADRVFPREQSLAVARGFGDLWRTHAGNTNATLLTAPAPILMQAQQEFIASWPQHFPIRSEIDGVFLPRRPAETIASSHNQHRRLLIGTNREESASFIGAHPAHDPGAADLGNLPLDKFSPVLARYRSVYPQLTDEQLRIRATTAEEYWIPSTRVADAFVKSGGKAWMYRLDYPAPSGLQRGYAHHSEELQFVWDRPSPVAEEASAEAPLTHEMSQAWVAFIKGEVPAAPDLPPWPQYTAETRSTMAFDTTSHVEQLPQEQERQLWNGLL